uniref:BPTI/Kunitz inhibitor domain-containing protein n=1 Tax=Parastrongyloides trichosuri TaxID=131310 RepID=A0A0N4ZPZ1_PARTI
MLSKTIYLVILFFIIKIKSNDNCLENRDVGYTCEEGVEEKRFYYHTKYKICSPFIYKGCGGTKNNFKTSDDCKNTCSSVVNDSNNITLPLAIKCGGTYSPNIKIDIVTCNNNGTCLENYECKNDVCCPTKDYICSMEWDSGKEFEGIVKHTGRYAFKKENNDCLRFSYFRNEGNLNNFLTYKSCLNFCKN